MSTARLNIVLLLATTLVTVLLAEWVLRQVLPAPIVWTHPQESYRHDDETGHWLQGNQQAYTHDKPVSVNAFGIRGPEFTPYPEPGVVRVLALGDSQTFGNGLVLDDTWPAQLERELLAAGGAKDYEVINAGLPASDTWQHEIMLGRLLERYHPDLVVLAFYINDFSLKPAAIAPSTGGIRSSAANRFIYLAKQSVLLLSARMAYQAIRQLFSPDEHAATLDAILRGESSDDIEARWRQVEDSLRSIAAVASGQSAGLTVALLPRRDQVSGQFPSNDYNRRLQATMERIGVPYVNMLGPLQAAHGEHGSELFIPWDGHNSALANGVIAKALANGLVVDGRLAPAGE